MVNAAGVKAGYLARKLGMYLPVEPRKRCVFVLSCPGAPNKHQMPLIVDTSGCYIRPESGSYLSGMSPPEASTQDQYQYLGNCPPTPPLIQQQSIDNKLGLMLGLGRGR